MFNKIQLHKQRHPLKLDGAAIIWLTKDIADAMIDRIEVHANKDVAVFIVTIIGIFASQIQGLPSGNSVPSDQAGKLGQRWTYPYHLLSNSGSDAWNL